MIIVSSDKSYPNRSGTGLRICIFAGVQNQFIDNESHKNRAIRRKLNFLWCLQFNFARSDRRLQIGDDLPQIGGKPNLFVIRVVSEALIGASNC